MGKVILFEPLGHNYFINRYRKRTPQLRDNDEHPLLIKDIKLAKVFFNSVKARYYNFFTLAAIPLINTVVFKPVFYFLDFMDKIFLNLFPFLKKYCWVTIITLSEPKGKDNI